MTKFYVDGINYFPYTDKALTILDTLPKGSYSLSYSDLNKQYYLQEIIEDNIQHKVYGDIEKSVDRVLNTFMSRSKTTGVLLSGQKGCGKTLFAKLLSIRAESFQTPTIIINAPYCGEDFNKFIQSIDQPCIIIFDEFEKVYDSEEQKSLLTILDGTYTTKKLFVMTCNDIWKIDSHMKNRPGRLFYHLRYDGLDQQFVEEYVTDNIKPEYIHYMNDLKRLPTMIKHFNFDMIKAVVEEINRYGDSVKDILKVINIDVESDNKSYEGTLLDSTGKVVVMEYCTTYLNPFVESVEVSLPEPKVKKGKKAKDGEPVGVLENNLNIDFTPNDIVSLENNQSRITYNKNGYTLIMVCSVGGSNNSLLERLF